MARLIADTIARAAAHSDRRSSALSGFDDRAVVITFLLYLLTVVSCGKYALSTVLALAAFPAFALMAGRLPVAPILTKVLLVSPFVALVAAGNLFLDRQAVASLGSFTVTGGMVSGLVIVTKGLLSVLAVVLLGYLISFYHVCLALRGLRVPRPFIMQLILLYRYLFVLGEEAVNLVKARDLRSFGRRGRGLRVTANMLGALLLRTMERAERIYCAMDARGFSGALPHALDRMLRPRDGALVIGSAAALAVVRALL